MNTRLDQIETRADSATDGPWEASVWDSGHSKFEMTASVITSDVGDIIADMDALSRLNNERHGRDDGTSDAYFIAHARTDVPALVAALRAVLTIHVPGEGSSQGYGTDGGYGYISPYCAGCEASDEYAVQWPCRTVRAIEEALA